MIGRGFAAISLFFILSLALGGLFVAPKPVCGGAHESVLIGPYCAAEQMSPVASHEVEKPTADLRVFEELLLIAAAWLLVCLSFKISDDSKKTAVVLKC